MPISAYLSYRGGSPSQSVNYGGSVHPFSGVTVTDPNATAAYQPNLSASFSISGGEDQGGTLSGTGVVAISQQSGNYVIDAPNLATFSNDLRSHGFHCREIKRLHFPVL